MPDHATNPADLRAEVENELSDLVETAAGEERDRIASRQPEGRRGRNGLFHLHVMRDGTEVVLRESATGPWRLVMPVLRIALYLLNRSSLHRLRQRLAAPDTIDAEEVPMAADYAADITLVEVLHDLRERGYTGEFRLEHDGAIFCVVCGISQRAQELITHGMRRVEGASDPGDEAMVLAIACRRCGEPGAIVLRYGPEAGVADATVLAGVDQGQIPTIPPLH